MDSSIKTLTITGAAASSGSEVKKSRRASRRKKVEDEAEESEPVQPLQQIRIEKTSVPSVLLAPKVPSVPSVPVQHQKPQLAQPVEKQEIKPVASATSVILHPPKVQRIKLQPKATHVQHIQKQVAGTRKARRISLSVSNLNHRFTRAKRVHDDTQKKSIDTIRNYLIERGVIQTKSRAPEKMLRSMYNDFNMLKDGQAL
jgi:outer membrane translocation and assembly module TamA